MDFERPGFPEHEIARNLQLTDFEADLREFLRGISQVIRLPYFTRLWVLQEVGLGKSAAALLGNREFELIVLLKIIAYLDTSVTLAGYFRIATAHQVAFSLFPVLSNTVYGEDYFYSDPDFLKMLLCTQRQMASDPRDYVYALLGHLSALIRGHLIMEPDYAKPSAALFHEVAVKLIETRQDLQVITTVYHCSEVDLEGDYPTWVP